MNKRDPSLRMSYGELATRAIEIGGKYSGEEVAEDDLNEMTVRAVKNLAGTGLIGVARDNLERTGTVPALAAGFIKIELDIETGAIKIIDYLGIADCGTVLHPQGLAAQIKSGAVMGFGMASQSAISMTVIGVSPGVWVSIKPNHRLIWMYHRK